MDTLTAQTQSFPPREAENLSSPREATRVGPQVKRTTRTRPRPHPLAGSGLVVASRRPSNRKAPTRRKRVALWGWGSRLPLSPWRQPRTGPSDEGAGPGPGLSRTQRGESREVSSLLVRTCSAQDRRGAPSLLFGTHQRLPCIGEPCAVITDRTPTFQIEKLRPRDGQKVAQRVTHKFRVDPRQKQFIHLFHKYLSRLYD